MPTRLNAAFSFFLLFSSFKQPQSFFFPRIPCTDISFSVKNCNFSVSWTKDGTAEEANYIKLKSNFAANFLKFGDHVYEVMPSSMRE